MKSLKKRRNPRKKTYHYQSSETGSGETESSETSETSSSTSETSEIKDLLDSELDPVVLTAEEEEEFQQLAAYYERDQNDTEEPHSDESFRCDFSLDRTDDELLKFLQDMSSSQDDLDLLATCHWNESMAAQKIYSLCNITTCIVNPDYFFASEEFPNHKVSTLLTELEKSKTHKNLSWTSVKRCLKIFLSAFEGFEKLADVFNLEEVAYLLMSKFAVQIESAMQREFPKPYWYQPFLTVTQTLEKGERRHRESTFHEYISALLNQIYLITGGGFPSRYKELQLTLPAQKSRPNMFMDVNPDFMVLGTRPTLMLVGEVKNFGCNGVRPLSHEGNRVNKVRPDTSDLGLTPYTVLGTDQAQGQGDQMAPTVNEKEKSFPSVTADEPRASTRKEQTGSSTKSEKSTITVRPLDAKERYKVNAYLPELFSQMLAAMQLNESQSTSFRYCKYNENVQFGFGVEGFKLRFVKLTIIALNKEKTASVNGLLSGQPIKCHISMTKELNLLKKHHLEIFYKMLLAMAFLCKC